VRAPTLDVNRSKRAACLGVHQEATEESRLRKGGPTFFSLRVSCRPPAWVMILTDNGLPFRSYSRSPAYLLASTIQNPLI
jgi:hypothetical protein